MDRKQVEELSFVSQMMLQATEMGYNTLARLLETRVHQIMCYSTVNEDRASRVIYESLGLTAAIKDYRTRTNADLPESKKHIETMAVKFNWKRP